MNILGALIYGITGLVVGVMIPKISYKIIEYKKGKENIEVKVRYIKLIITVLNVISWSMVGYYSSNTFISFLLAIQIALAITIAYIDINIRIIPNELVLTVLVVGIIYQSINYGLYGIIGSIISMIFIMIIFTAVAGFMGFGKVGAGDVKLAGAIGFSVGYPLIVLAMGSMAIILLVYILVGLALKRIQLTTMLPLGPFLSAGYVLSLISVVIK